MLHTLLKFSAYLVEKIVSVENATTRLIAEVGKCKF